MKELGDGEWVEVYESRTVGRTEFVPSQTEGSVLFIQDGLGKYLKYVYEDGRYNLVGTVE